MLVVIVTLLGSRCGARQRIRDQLQRRLERLQRGAGAARRHLYGARPDPLTGPTTYPPVSFHLIAWLAGHGDPVRTGRWVSLIALPATGVLIGLIVRELGADAVVAAFSGLLYILGIAVFLPDRLGIDDLQLHGEWVSPRRDCMATSEAGTACACCGFPRLPSAWRDSPSRRCSPFRRRPG